MALPLWNSKTTQTTLSCLHPNGGASWGFVGVDSLKPSTAAASVLGSSSSAAAPAAPTAADPEEEPELTLEDFSAAVAEDPAAEILDEWSAAAPADTATAAAAAPEETVGPAKRKNKKKFFVPREAQVWFLRWAHHMHVHHDVSWRQSWAVAAKVCPQLFAHSDANSFRRWRPAEAEPAPPASSGRKSPLSVAQKQELEVLVHSLVSRGVPVSLTVMHAIFAKKLKPVTISRTWVYYFLRSMGMSSRSTKAVAGRRKFTPEKKKELQHLLCLKAAWLQREYAIPGWAVYNLDETCVQLIPKAARCWTYAGKRAETVEEAPSTRMSCTVTLAMPPPTKETDGSYVAGPCFAQVISRAKLNEFCRKNHGPVR